MISLSIDFFEIEKENQLKVDSNELQTNWFQLKIFAYQYFFWSSKGKAIERRSISIESLSYQYVFEVEKKNQLKVDSNELKTHWFQLKSFLINRFLWGLKGKSIESRWMSVETIT